MEENKLLPLGSIVILKNGEQKLSIIGRGQLFDDDGTIGYFEYSSVLYPQGMVDTDDLYFFNHKDIAEIIFEGYRDEDEEEFLEIYNEEISKSDYPKLSVE